MTILDFVLIAILILCMAIGYFKGLFRQIFNVLSFILGIVLFNVIYPIFNKLMLKSFIFTKVKKWIVYNLNLNDFISSTQESIISKVQDFSIPKIIKDLLIENNNDTFYKIFKVFNPTDYIANFLATIIVSLISVFLVILVVIVIIIILSKTTKLLSKMPISRQVDKIGGLALGTISGLFIIWFLGIIILVLSFFPKFNFLQGQLNGFLTSHLINEEFLLKFILNLILKVIR